MNEATQSLMSPSSGAAVLSEEAMLPEETLERFTSVLALGEDDAAFQKAMVEYARAQTGARAAVLLEVGAGGDPQPLEVSAVANVSTGFAMAPEVKGLAASALQAKKCMQAGILIDGTAHILIGVTFEVNETAPPQLLMLLLGPARTPFVTPIFTILHLLTRAFVEREQFSRSKAFEEGFMQATLLVDLFSRASLAPTLNESVSIVSREVRQFVNCARVAVGIGKGTRLKVEGLSGFAKVEARSHGTRMLASVMREAMALEKVIAWPLVEEAESQIWPATDQTELLEAFAVKQAVTVPMVTAEGKIVGAWMFLFKGGEPFTMRKFSLMEAATPHAASLLELVRTSKPTGIRGAIHRFMATASRFKKAAILTLIAFVVLLLLIPFPHRVSAPCEVQPQTMRQVAAPFPGVLDEVFVKPGDRVTADQLLANLDGKEVGWKHAEALAEREMALKKRDLARSTSRVVAEVQMAQLEADSAAVRVNLLEYQKEHLDIRAPFDGFVLSGSLERSKGVPVSEGQKLFDIAPIDTMYLEIAVADSDINWVEPGMELTMRLEARPREKYEAVIREVYPVSESKESENVFICLAEIDNSEADLRPGMRGKVKIESGRRPLGWILFHKPWDFIQLHL